MKNILSLYFIALLLLFSCVDKKIKNAAGVSPFKASPIDSAYASVRPVVQVFTIDNNQVNKIIAKNGTEVLVPAACFVTADGKAVENVEIEVVEAFSLPEFVSSGLATVSNGRLLMSNGMIYINARSGNEILQLKGGNSLTVSMPTMTANGGYQMFTGDGGNWAIDTSMTNMDYAVTLPLNLLYPDGRNTFWYVITNTGGKNEKIYIYDSTIVSVTNPKYENTVIATEEFASRIWALRWMQDRMSYLTNSDFYFDRVDVEDQKFNLDIFRVYFDHPLRPLKESDSIAKKMYIDYYNANKEKLLSFFDAVNRHKREYYSNSSDTDYFFDFRKTSFETDYMRLLDFLPANEKELLIVDDHGVKLESADASKQLAAKGVDQGEINTIMKYHFIRQEKIRQLSRQKTARENQGKYENLYQSTVFSVSTMGWINCDRFYDDPAAAKATIYVVDNSAESFEHIDFSLVIPELNVRLSAYPAENGKWSFTKKEGPYIKLPIGKDAVITGVSLKGDSVFYACREIKIGDGLNEVLTLKSIPKASLKDSLVRVLKG
jgi:hypothetical protein